MSRTLSNRLPPLLNRDFKLPDDNRYHIVPIGEFPVTTDDGEELVQVVDHDAIEKMRVNFANAAMQQNFPGLLIDYDHFSHDRDKESRAAGWLVNADANGNGLEGDIRFSNSGRADVEGGDYRFVSPVFDRASAEPLGGNRFRVTKLIRLALTNDPNMRGMVPLTNRQGQNSLSHDATNPTERPGEGNTKLSAGPIAICNRAGALQKEIPNLSFPSAFELAKSEPDRESQTDEYALPPDVQAKLIDRKARALLEQFPGLSYTAAFNMARRNESEPPPYLVKGRVRSMDALLELDAGNAATRGVVKQS